MLNSGASSLFQVAEDLRMADSPHQALKHYRLALDLGPGPELKRQIYHMMGVAHKMSGEYEAALADLTTASDGADVIELGNLLRDLGAVYTLKGDFDLAFERLEESAKYLWPIDQTGYWATYGFAGRLYLARGEKDLAYSLLVDADRQLKHLGNRHFELYNKLPLIVAALCTRHLFSSFRFLIEAWQLNLNYGSKARRKLLFSLWLGLVLGERWALRHWESFSKGRLNT